MVPIYEASPSYPLVRDFAYSTLHPLHYGPAPEVSEPASIASTPISESQRRLSDPTRASWGTSLGGWSAGPWGGDGSVNDQQVPPFLMKDGHPYAEDDDLPSPVFTSRHKRHKTTIGAFGGGQGRGRGRGGDDVSEGTPEDVMYSPYYDKDRGYYAGTREDGSETYYVSEGDVTANGPGGEYVTYPPEQARHRSGWAPYNRRSQRDSHFAITLPNRSYADQQQQQQQPHSAAAANTEPQYISDDASDSLSSPGNEDGDDEDEPRGSSYDYQFGLGAADEEMHGKAVALFDFARENENELPLVEGQVIWVSYRHGQGWLVAQDPHTHESGLVPEEYVRLLRDIQGGLGSLNTTMATGYEAADDIEGMALETVESHDTPTQTDQETPLAGSPRLLPNGGSDDGGGGGDGGGGERHNHDPSLRSEPNQQDQQQPYHPQPQSQPQQQQSRQSPQNEDEKGQEREEPNRAAAPSHPSLASNLKEHDMRRDERRQSSSSSASRRKKGKEKDLQR